jgi:hypothetical protein
MTAGSDALGFREECLLLQLQCDLFVGGQDHSYSFGNARNREDGKYPLRQPFTVDLPCYRWMSTGFAVDQSHIGFLQVGERHLWFKLRLRLMFLSNWLNFELYDNKKSVCIMIFFLTDFFHKIQWLPNFFRKTFTPLFSKNFYICIRHYWLNYYTFCGVLPQVKISAQPLKSPCTLIIFFEKPDHNVNY